MKIVLIFTVLMMCIKVHAQQKKLAKVSMADMLEKVCPVDSISPAMITYFYSGNEDNISFRDIKVRYKIYDFKKAHDFLNYTFYMSKDAKYSNLNITVYNLENNEILKTEMSKNNIYKEEYNKRINKIAIPFEGIKDGSIIDISYNLGYPNNIGFSKIYIEQDIPVKYQEIVFKYPDFFAFTPDIRGAVMPVKHIEDANYDGDNLMERRLFVYENVPAFIREPYVLNYENLKTTLDYELSSIHPKHGTSQLFSNTWNDVHNTLMKSEQFGGELKYVSFFKDIAKEIVDPKDDKLTKIKKAQKYVQNNIKWNKYYGLVPELGVKKAFKTKTGNIADINFILINLLNAMEIEAYPIVLSSVENGIVNPNFPSLDQLNYVFACVLDSMEPQYFIDASHQYASVNILPKRALSNKGYIVHQYKMIEAPLSNFVTSQKLIIINCELNATFDKIIGNYSAESNGYLAMNTIEDFENDKMQFVKKISNKYPFEINTVENKLKANTDVFQQSFNFEISDGISKIGNKIIFNPKLFLVLGNNPFVEKTRKFNLEFECPSNKSETCIIEIPKGYKIVELPKNISIGIQDNLITFDYTVSQSGNKIEITTVLLTAESTISPANYGDIKVLFEKIVEAENQLLSIEKL
jgi:Domain of Unknown Function with PDB structure (DUF3858)